MENNKNIFLDSENLYLRNLTVDDISDKYLQWLNDQETSLQNSHALFPYTMAQLKNYVESAVQNKSQLVLAIVWKENNVHVGNISLQNINWVNRSAEYAILLGEKQFWGKGIAYEASIKLIKHGFENLNLHRIYCGTTAENTGMKKLALKIGMKQEGIRREAFYKHGKFQDIIEYGILKNEFQND